MAKKKSLSQKAAELLAQADAKAAESLDEARFVSTLRKNRLTTDELSARFKVSGKQIEKRIAEMQQRGVLIYLFGDRWGIDRQPISEERRYPFVSTKDNRFIYGFTSDNHLCSKYERNDVLRELYRRFSDRGITRVYNSGNWIDGEARFNMHELKVHGMDNQLNYLAENYPQIDGIETYAIAGDDHEGWYGQREGIDIGKHAEHIMHAAGRTDWFDLGYMESYVPFVNKNTGVENHLLVMHPGGGSSYAISYRPQKIMEALQGGEKPGALQIGHYHKSGYNIIRSVHTYQAMCTQDQTTFMRKKNLDAHVGGGVVEIEQDPNTGAFIAFKFEVFQFFNTGYYNGRWNLGGGVVLPDRGL